jgi:hypothetical protein
MYSFRGLLVGIRDGDIDISSRLSDLDPDLVDTLSAYARPRGMSVDTLVVRALELFMLDAAETAWNTVILDHPQPTVAEDRTIAAVLRAMMESDRRRDGTVALDTTLPRVEVLAFKRTL